MLLAGQRGWIMVSHNAEDYAVLHDGWLRWSAAWGVNPRHAGILTLPQATRAERSEGRMGALDLAQLIIDLLNTGALHPNELWDWRRGRGWIRFQ